MGQRFEYKYKVPVEILPALRREIEPFVQIDAFAGIRRDKAYTVRSIYFDTACFSCYHEKKEGVPYRNKYRIRGYNEGVADSPVFMEIKRKKVQVIDKDRAMLTYDKLIRLLNSGAGRQELSAIFNGQEAEARKFLFYFYSQGLHPVILITYTREAFSGRFDNDLRITFDKDIRSIFMPRLNDLYRDNNFLTAMNGYFILELKFSHAVPLWFRYLIRRYDLLRSALSKYNICLDSHLEKSAFAALSVPAGKSSGTRLSVLMSRNIKC